ncbi:unnamed protein product, partial [Hymenolepis diminuta]
IELRGYGSPNLFSPGKYPYPDEFLNIYKGFPRLRKNETFATWYTQHRDIYKNIMADLSYAARITITDFQLRRSLAMSGRSAPAAEFRGQDLRTAGEEIFLSEQLCVPTKCDRMRTYSVSDLVYILSHKLNQQWTAAIIIKPLGGDIYDVENGKDT